MATLRLSMAPCMAQTFFSRPAPVTIQRRLLVLRAALPGHDIFESQYLDAFLRLPDYSCEKIAGQPYPHGDARFTRSAVQRLANSSLIER
jgi:hypothetical protein